MPTPSPTGEIVSLARLINTQSGNVRHRVTLQTAEGGLWHYNTAPDAAIGSMITNHLHTRVTLILNPRNQVIGAIPTHVKEDS